MFWKYMFYTPKIAYNAVKIELAISPLYLDTVKQNKERRISLFEKKKMKPSAFL